MKIYLQKMFTTNTRILNTCQRFPFYKTPSKDLCKFYLLGKRWPHFASQHPKTLIIGILLDLNIIHNIIEKIRDVTSH